MSVALDPIDLSSAVVGSTGKLDWTGQVQPGSPVGVRLGRATLRIHNESNAGLKLQFSGTKSDRIPAGGWGDYELAGENRVSFIVEYLITGPAPNVLLGVVYEPGEPVPPLQTLGNSSVGVGGTVTTSSASSVKNDGNNAPTSIVESTPGDQASSSVSLNNDASGFFKVLSANVLRTILNVVRGNSGVGKATITLGDSGDTSITTLYGTVGAGSVVPTSTLSGTVPGSSISGDVAANQIGPGALDTDVTIVDANISGDVAVGRVGPGALDTDVTMGAAEVQPGTFPVGEYIHVSPANGSGAPDTLALQDGAGANPLIMGVSKAGDNVNVAGGFIFDSIANSFAIKGGKTRINAPVTTFTVNDTYGFPMDVNGRAMRPSVTFAGTGAGTANHGMIGGVTPNYIGITENVVNNTETVGIDSTSSTTVHVNQGVASQAWLGFAVRC